MKKEVKNNQDTKNLSRRDFIAKSASVASFLIASPSVAFGYEANSRIKVGCIGLGKRGFWIARHLAERQDYQITAIADYFEDVSKEIGKELNIPAQNCFSGLNGYKKLLETGVEAVFLETPPYCFPEHAGAALDAGCHIFMAKPVAVDVPGSLKIMALGKKASANKKVFLVDFQTRTDEFFIEGIKRVHEGWLGKMGLINAVYCDNGFPDPPRSATIENRLKSLIWVNDISLGGGKFVNAGVHAIDVGLWIANKLPVAAMGSCSITRDGAHGDSPDTYSATYIFEGGLIMNYYGEYFPNQNGVISCHAYGSEAYLQTYYTGGKVMIRGTKRGWGGGENPGLYQSGMKQNVETFRRSITNHIYDNPTVEPSANATLACILGQMAGQKNTKITWEQMLKEAPEIKPDLSGLKA